MENEYKCKLKLNISQKNFASGISKVVTNEISAIYFLDKREFVFDKAFHINTDARILTRLCSASINMNDKEFLLNIAKKQSLPTSLVVLKVEQDESLKIFECAVNALKLMNELSKKEDNSKKVKI